MSVEVDKIVDQVITALNQVESHDQVEPAFKRFLSKKNNVFSELEQHARSLEGNAKGEFFTVLKSARQKLENHRDMRRRELMDELPIVPHFLDRTRPGINASTGALHPTIQIMYDLNDAFEKLNFSIYEGPEVSNELYEFDNMNFPDDHPARESMDTYWLVGSEGKTGADRYCIRPHLTGASVRYMQENEGSVRFAYPGRVYRNEDLDPRHERAFFQYEVLMVDRDISFRAGRLLIDTILETVFGRKVDHRMRAGFFPFVEPGFEIDMKCLVCEGAGCSVCKNVGWIEVMPGGVPHPNVLLAGGRNPEEWGGFYVNIGLDRLVMMRYAINDVRTFHSADLRFLQQFK